jgi:pyridinium-3,5-biscarboxylic acid mononucleotide sulfurtransferase
MSPTEDLANGLIREIAKHSSVVVAFSGGVDSAVVAAAAFRALTERSMAITGVGQAVPESDRQSAREVAAAIGIQHKEIPTNEILNENYIRNDARRCYFCKSTLYGTLRAWADANSYQCVMSGTNQDDLGDYRPGLQAAAEFFVVAPLVNLGIKKQQVRELAAHFGLSVADKPSSPCLASRIAYGQSVTPDRLGKIEKAELYLESLGFRDVRVRLHADNLVRLELSVKDIALACEQSVRTAIHEQMRSYGFQFVTLDLMGRQSGSLNRVLPIVY